ncbi:MAG: hypothetical protein M0P94_00120 [Candidatus Absconditabacterales bacterium]|nr:hypothetical protein [Candidatus Absconditabacterales bacterium]
MKKLFFFIFAAMAASGFSQVTFIEIKYDSLDVTSRKLFSQYGVANPYGETIKIEADSVIAIYKITDIKKSRKMVVDSTGTKAPEYVDQFMTIFEKDGQIQAFVSLDDPMRDGGSQSAISTLLSQEGLKQGDDEFDSPKKIQAQTDYPLSSEW